MDYKNNKNFTNLFSDREGKGASASHDLLLHPSYSLHRIHHYRLLSDAPTSREDQGAAG